MKDLLKFQQFTKRLASIYALSAGDRVKYMVSKQARGKGKRWVMNLIMGVEDGMKF